MPTILPPPPQGEQSPTSDPSSPTASIVRPLQKGCHGADVAEWQATLVHLGFPLPRFGIDAKFGAETDSATEQLQIVAGLMPTGIVDMRTRAAAASMDPPSAPATVKTPPDLQVPKVRTPLTQEQLLTALRTAHIATFSSSLSTHAARVAIAHLMFEHGARLDHVYNNNLGNLMRGDGWHGPWFAMEAEEIDQHGHPYMRKSQWRAFSDPAEGCAGYFSRLKAQWPDALVSLEIGNPISFVNNLKIDPNPGPKSKFKPYFTASLNRYREGVVGVWRGVALP